MEINVINNIWLKDLKFPSTNVLFLYLKRDTKVLIVIGAIHGLPVCSTLNLPFLGRGKSEKGVFLWSLSLPGMGVEFL